VVSGRDLAEELHRRSVIASDEKVMVPEAALQRIAEWRRRGLRTGFTNGCFDLIHPGHVHLLAQARAACDRLVVALNTDASVRRLKGPERPIRSETVLVGVYQRQDDASSARSIQSATVRVGKDPLSSRGSAISPQARRQTKSDACQ
jgi:cytidyltransferase-like protein